MIWWIGNIALAIVLFRGRKTGWLSRFPIFTSYLTLGLAMQWELRTRAFHQRQGARAIIVPVALSAWGILPGVAAAAQPSAMTLAEVERAARFTQLFLFLAFVVLAVYFQVSMDRNLGGYVTGYGFYLFMSVLSLTIWKVIPQFSAELWAAFGQPTYLATLLFWCVMLWRVSNTPAVVEPVRGPVSAPAPAFGVTI